MIDERTAARAHAEVLLRAVAARCPGSPPDLSLIDSHRLQTTASYHGVSGYVARWIDAAPSCAAWREPLRASRVRAVAMHLRVVAALHDLAPILDDAAGAWAVLKGPLLSEFHHGSPELRSYSDLDLLVPPTRFHATIRALEGVGARVGRPVGAAPDAGEIPLTLPDGTVVDLHRHLINDARVRSQHSIDTDELLAELRLVELTTGRYPALSADAELTHVCLHLMHSGADRLIWLKDVDLLVRTDVRWSDVLARARAWGAGPAVGTALQEVRHLFHSPIPEEVVTALVPSRAWRSVVRLAFWVAPPTRSLGEPSVRRIVARSSRRTGRASALELARRSYGYLTGRGAGCPGAQGTGAQSAHRDDRLHERSEPLADDP